MLLTKSLQEKLYANKLSVEGTLTYDKGIGRGNVRMCIT